MKKHETIQWLGDFHDLPQGARTCRHVLTGELQERTCPNGFDCRGCDLHQRLLKGEKDALQPAQASGFQMPLDRLYHRGHTWVKLEADGTATVGLDDFSLRLFGTPDTIDLPPVGTQVHVNRPGWIMHKRDSVVRILSPVDGSVIEIGGPEQGWYLRVRPLAPGIDTRHLLHGEEVRLWIAGEMERLRAHLQGVDLAPTLADWDGIWGEMFLEP